MDKAFKTLLESINAHIEVLLKNGYPLYDVDNLEYFICGLKYDSHIDEIVFETLEDKSKSLKQ